MADFEPAVQLVLDHERGLSDNPSDPGGLTNWGISQRSYPSLDIRSLTRDAASKIYEIDFWQPYHYGLIASQSVAGKVFDAGVNLGPIPSIRALQQALGFFLAGPIVMDGKIGAQTAAMAGEVPEAKLLNEIRARYSTLYHEKAVANPKEETFVMGWMRRASCINGSCPSHG